MIDQLPLDIASAPSFEREDLVVTKANAPAVDLVDAWPNWPVPVVALVGPVGSGKTHIAGAWSELARAQVLDAPTIGDGQKNLAINVPILVEDVDRNPLNERGFFHLINAVREAKQTLLLTARTWPSAWNYTLPDLTSRLKAATLIELNEPDDDLLTGVLMKLIADRQMQVDEGVVKYIVTRMERSLESANQVIRDLDQLSLAKKKPITRALAAQVL